MAQSTWGATIPNTGALRVSHISSKLYTAAVAETIFMDHVSTEPNFGKGVGEAVTLQRVGRQSELSDYSLSESDRIGETSLTVTGKVITLLEFGKALITSRLLEHFATFNVRDAVQGELKDQMRLSLDSRACRAFKQASLKYVPTGVASYNLATNGTPATSALANMNVYHAGAIRDLLYDTYKAKALAGDNYVGIFRTLGLRGIKEDAQWEEWQKYMHPEAKFNSEIGRMEQIRFIETNHGNSTVGGIGLTVLGTNDVLGEGLVFGEDAVRFVESLSPEIIIGKEDDFGRVRSVAWYGIYEFGLVWDTANVGEAKIIHVTSVD